MAKLHYIFSLMSLFLILFAKTNQKSTSIIYLAGDSTVQTYDEKQYIAGWGQYLSLFLDQNIKVVNAAKGGRSSRSFINEGRLFDIEGGSYKFSENGGKSISSTIQPGDFLFIQFGHNDDDTNLSKSYSTLVDRMVPLGKPDGNGKYPVTEGIKVPTKSLPNQYVQLATQEEQSSALNNIKQYGSEYFSYDCGGTYKWYLKQYISLARKKNAIPVLVTPVSRVSFSNGKVVGKPGSFGENFAYIQAVRQLANEEDCLLIDLHKTTVSLLETVTQNNSGYLMALKPNTLTGEWPKGYDKTYNNASEGCTGIEGTHYNKFGAFVTAGFVAESILRLKGQSKNGGKEAFTFEDYILKEPSDVVKPSSKISSEVIEKIYKLFNQINIK